MKLPGARRQQVQTLGRRDPNIGHESGMRQIAARERLGDEKDRALEFKRATAQEDLRKSGMVFDPLHNDIRIAQAYYQAGITTAQAKGSMYNVIGDTITNVGIAGTAIWIKNQEIKAERELQEADLYMAEIYSNFQNRYGGRDFISGDEVTGDMDTPQNRARKNIPTAEVLPDMLNYTLEQSAIEVANTITDKRFRDEWLKDLELKRVQTIGDARVVANKEYERQVVETQYNDLNKAVNANNFSLAGALINGMRVSSPVKTQLKEEVAAKEEVFGYKNLITEGAEQGLLDAKSFMSQSFEDYQKNGGNLNPGDRLTALNMVNGEINRIMSAKEGELKADYSIIKKRMGWAEQAALEGRPLDPEQLLELHSQMRDSMNKPGGVNVGEMREFEVILSASEMVNEINKYGPEHREQMLQSYDRAARAPGQDIEYVAIGQYTRKAHESLMIAEGKNMLYSAEESGHQITPISFESPDELSRSLETRVKEHDAMFEIYGQSQGYLTKQEATRMSQRLDKLSAQDSLGYYGAIAAATDEEVSVKIFDQLSVDGSSTLKAMAGELFVQGNPEGAELILMGSAFMKDNKGEMTELNKSLSDTVNSHIASLYYNNPSRRAAVKEATQAAYVGAIVEDPSKFNEYADEDLVSSMLDVTVGERFMQGGKLIPSFTRSMPENEFNNYIRSLPDSFFGPSGPDAIDNGQDGSLDGKTIRMSIIDGSFQLQPSGQGRYFVLRGGIPLRSIRGGSYELIYDPTIEIRQSNIPLESKVRVRPGI